MSCGPRDPVAHRFVDRVLQRAAAGIDALNRRAEQAHAEHVERLPPHVLGAHVDDAFEPEQRAGRGARDAVLPGAGLGDDARLAHAPGEQRLAERVVDLVRAGVREIFALQENAPAAGSCRRGAAPPTAASAGRRNASSSRVSSAANAGSLRAPSDTRARAPRSAPPASRAQSVRRTRRSSRAHRDRAARTSCRSLIVPAALAAFMPLARCDECAQQSVILDAGLDFDARRHVDAHTAALRSIAWPHIRRRQSAGEHDAPRRAISAARAASRRSCPVPPCCTGSCASSRTQSSAMSGSTPSIRSIAEMHGAHHRNRDAARKPAHRRESAPAGCRRRPPPLTVVGGRIDEHADRRHESAAKTAR